MTYAKELGLSSESLMKKTEEIEKKLIVFALFHSPVLVEARQNLV